MTAKRLCLVLTMAVGVSLLLRDARADDPPKHKYMGVSTCKMCHQKEAEGQQFKIWSESKHAKAWEDLASDKAKEAATKKGIQGNPQEAPECLKCHVTGYGEAAELFDKKFDPKNGVQCESCHGAGGDYWKKEVMKDKNKAIECGLTMPDEKTCTKCHNTDSPFYQEFKFDEFKAKIAHEKPKEQK